MTGAGGRAGAVLDESADSGGRAGAVCDDTDDSGAAGASSDLARTTVLSVSCNNSAAVV